MSGVSTKQIVFAASLCASLSAEVAWGELMIHVAPSANPQTTLADLKKDPDTSVTLTEALSILKDPALRDAEGVLKESITIRLDGGIYRLGETIDIDAASGGDDHHLVTIEGPNDASAIISGGRAISGFMPVSDGTVLVRLPKAARSQVLQADLAGQGISDYGKRASHGFGEPDAASDLELFYRNQPMTPARWPSQGWAKITATPDGEKGSIFTVQGANLRELKNEPNLMATGYWFQNWADATIPIRSVDVRTQHITLAESPPVYGLQTGQPVFFQNILTELSQPGEWYLDRAKGVLYFWPPKPLQENEVEVSLLDNLLVIDNANDIHIRGITFQSARGDAITVRGGHRISITNSVIRDIGSRGAVIGGQNNGLSNMLIENIGAAGVVLQGGDRQTLTPGNLYVEGSTIRHFGRISRTYQPAVRLTGVGNSAVNNQIYDSPHTGILFWGNDHLISRNDIHDVCKETGDAGAIYTGLDWTARGTVISDNHIHDIAPNVALGGTIAVYLDDQASGITVRGNLIEHVYIAVLIARWAGQPGRTQQVCRCP